MSKTSMNKKKTILLTSYYESVPLNILRKAIGPSFNLISFRYNNDTELVDNVIEDVDYILASGRFRIDKELLSKAKKLKMVQRTGVGLDSIDLDALKEKRIPLYVNAGVNSESVAELALLFILSGLRKLTIINNNLKKGVWNKQGQGIQTSELCGKRVGLVGMGNIAKKVASMLIPFDTDVYYFDVCKLSDDEESKLNVSYLGLEELFRTCDIISLHCPLNESTKHIINDESIRLMKNGVVLINTARGGLIKTEDLIKSLRSNKFSFVCLDVYENEPIKESELLGFENVITTPHIGGITLESFGRMMEDAIRNIKAYDEGNMKEIEKYRYEHK